MSAALRLGLGLLTLVAGGLALIVGVIATLVLLASLTCLRRLRG
jgi:hypothetical protein